MEEVNCINPIYREWNAKVFATPKLPRGNNGMIYTLNLVLNAVKNRLPINTNLEIEDSSANCNLEYLCVQLRPIGLVKQMHGVWELTKEAELYLNSSDPQYLAKIFCANIKFFPELIHYLKEEMNSKDLYNIAINDYKLAWGTRSEINSRLKWLREFELIEYNDYKMTYKLNEKGIEFEKNIEYTKAEEICFCEDNTKQDSEIDITEFGTNILSSSNEELKDRNENIGYIPGNISNILYTFSEYIQLTYNAIDIKYIVDFSRKTFNIADSSTRHFIVTLTNMQFIEHKSRSIIKASDIALKWNEKKNPIDLLCWMHNKFLFFFEILKELDGTSLTNKQLATIAKMSYGFSKENIDEIRKRIKILLINNLIMEDSINTYTITKKGKLLLQKVTIQEKSQRENCENIEKNKRQIINTTDAMLTEMRFSSRDSSNPNRFEKALKEVFELLGFESILLGGSGKTDILLKTHTTPKFSYTVAVEAKSTALGNVTESVIDFDTIKEHKKKHSADYNVIVGPSFHGNRVIERAKEHDVLLLNIDDLEYIVIQNNKVPLNFNTYRKLFNQTGIADITVLDKDRDIVEKNGILIQAIMDCLIEESDDEFTEGILTERDIYRSLRNSNKIKDLNPNEIQLMLEFLASPLIGCVAHSKDGYYAIESLKNISKKLEFYSRSCK